MEDRNIAYSLWNKLQGDGWQLRLPRCIRRKARRQKTSCIKSKLLWGMMRVEKLKSTMVQNTMSGRMKKWRHHRLQLKVGSIWNILTVVPFSSFTAQLQTNRPKTGWLKSHKPSIFWIAMPCCIQISLTLYDTLTRKGVTARRKRLTFDPPPSAVLKKFPALMTIGRKLESRMVVVLVSSWSK